MAEKRILTVQDLSCMGQCSIMAAAPILSSCGFETCVLPTALLSNHTDEHFHGFTFRDLTDEIPGITAKWKKDGVVFDAVSTGYLGNTEQIDLVKNLVFPLAAPHGVLVVDPAMADNGKLYTGFDGSFVEKMRELCAAADIILPNLTEAALLAGSDFLPAYQTKEEVEKLLRKLAELGPETVVLTGVAPEKGKIGNAVFSRTTGLIQYYFTERVPQSYPGTGDCFAAAFTGALVSGFVPAAAARTAADFVLESLLQTCGEPSHWYGVNFERALPLLVHRLNHAEPKSGPAKRAAGERREFVIDGSRFSDLAGFYREVTEVFTDGSIPVSTLDGFQDVLRGGFGKHGFGEPIAIRWTHWNKSRQALGYEKLLTIVGIILSEEGDHDCLLKIAEM